MLLSMRLLIDRFLGNWMVLVAKKSTPKPSDTNDVIKANPFGYVKSNSTEGHTSDGTAILKEVVGSGWDLVVTLGVTGFVLSLIYCGIWLATNRNAGADVKQHFLVKCGIFIAICGGVTIFSILFQVGKSMI